MKPACLALLVLTAATLAEKTQPLFTDVAQRAGIHAIVRSGSAEKRYLPETVTGGVCLIDYDNDGYLDIYIVNGSNLEAVRSGHHAYDNHLYRNRGNGNFEDVTEKAGVAGSAGWGMGCSVADYNNDGFPDLYVTNLGRNLLYRNNGDGSFTEVGAASGTAHSGWSTGSTWGDFDHDGWLDLYVANYVDYNIANPPAPGSGPHCKFLDIDVACGPGGLTPARHVFFHNNGDGTFTDETAKRGLSAPPSFGLGVCAGDYDNNGALDIFVANDSMPNYLFYNRGDGTFQELGLESGVAFNDDGNPQACMGADIADYDNDGNLDIIVTNFANDTNTVYHNEGKGQFSDATTRAGQRDSYPYMSWGVGFVDFDNDGLRDLYVVNGHLYPQVDRLRNNFGYRQHDLFYRNLGGGRFRNVSSLLPHAKHVGRGAAFGDLNNDGRVDVVISNIDDAPNVLLNRDSSANHWILIRVLSAKGARDAIGARITITTESARQTAEVRSGCSYLSSSDPRVHFGLGAAVRIKELDVRWPSGKHTHLSNVMPDQILTVREPSSE